MMEVTKKTGTKESDLAIYTWARLSHDLGRGATYYEVAAEMDLPVERMQELLMLTFTCTFKSNQS